MAGQPPVTDGSTIARPANAGGGSPVAREQPVGLLEGVGADQEVGDHAVAGAAAPPVAAPGRPARDAASGLDGEKATGKAASARRQPIVREDRADLGPDDVARDDRADGEARPQRRESGRKAGSSRRCPAGRSCRPR